MSSSEKKVPKSLKECYATDNVSSHLWSWSNWLELWGRRVFGILIIVGIILTIGEAIIAADAYEDLVFLSMISSLITWGWYAFLEYCAYHVLSLIIASLATIVQNTRITANVALYNVAKDEGALNEETPKSTSSTIV